jgi:hypothetical protein
MNIVISFATGRFIESQKLLEKKSYEMGADKVISYNRDSLDSKFISENYNILKHSRGSGYWLWKPYLIKKTLDECNVGDVVVYCDSGMYPIRHLDNMFSLMKNREICLFKVHETKNKNWTKIDCFNLMDCFGDKFTESEQVNAAVQIYKKTNKSLHFVEKMLYYSCDENIISDKVSITGNEMSSFKDHRHDQSIITNMAIKENIDILRDPTQYGNKFSEKYKNSNYEQIFHHHRGKM